MGLFKSFKTIYKNTFYLKVLTYEYFVFSNVTSLQKLQSNDIEDYGTFYTVSKI